MESLAEDDFFKYNSGVLEKIRSKYDLNGLGRMKEAVEILQEWIRKQPHFRKKEFGKIYWAQLLPLIFIEHNFYFWYLSSC